MLPVAMSVAEYLFVLTGIGMLMTGIVQYGAVPVTGAGL